MSLFDRVCYFLERNWGIDPMILILLGMIVLTVLSLFGWRPW